MSSICDDLRAAILQAAMQGKLTKQLPEDGTAEELLEQIKAEKEKLIAEGKIKKQKPLAPIADDEIPFEIPENWKWVRLSCIFSITAGGTPSRSNPKFWNGNIPWVKIGDMNSKYTDNVSEYITEDGLNSSSAKIFSVGTLLYSVFASIGTVSILKIEAATNQAIAGLSKYYEDLNTDYLFNALLSLKEILLKQARGCAQLNINQKILSEAIIPLPPLAEQERIVEKIDELMARVADLEKSANALASLKKSFPDDIKASLLQAAMQGKLTEQLPEDGTAEELLEQIKAEKEKLIAEGKIKKQKPLAPITDDENPFEIPDNWKWVRLPEVADSMLGKTLNKSTDMGEEKPYLCSINIYWEGISLDKIKTAKFSKNDIRQYLLRKNDLLVCEGGDVGRAAIWTNEREMYYQNALHRIRFYGGINAEYILEVLNCYKRMGIIEDYSKGVTIKHFVQTSLNKMPIPLPPLAEQKRIVEKINHYISIINVIDGQIRDENR